jgi:hypothetical protein
MEGHQGGQEAVLKLMCLGTCDAGIDRGFDRGDGAQNPDDRRALGGDFGQLNSRPDGRIHGRNRQPFFSGDAAGTQIPHGRAYGSNALLRHWETQPPVLLTH